VVKTPVEVIKPFYGRVYDPCRGSGGMFVQSARFVEHHTGAINNLSSSARTRTPPPENSAA
jgi:type I restriction enzyme M protein